MKKILALILALSMVLTFAACGGNDTGNTTAPVSEVEDVIDENASMQSYEELLSAAAEGTTAAGNEASTNEGSQAVTEEDGSTPAGSTAPAATTAPAVIVPTDAVGVLSLYNYTINNAFSSKVGFNKERYTDNENLDAGVAFKTFKSLVYKFMGIGADNKYTETVTKGKWESDANKNYLRKSTLVPSDINNATCTQSGDKYIITLFVKNGSTVGSSSSRKASTPIDKCGICVGNEDKGYYDHKTGPVIYDAIDDMFSGAVIDESYSGAKVVATLDAQGHLVSLLVEYSISTTINTNKIGSATATGTTHIKYTKFVY